MRVPTKSKADARTPEAACDDGEDRDADEPDIRKAADAQFPRRPFRRTEGFLHAGKNTKSTRKKIASKTPDANKACGHKARVGQKKSIP